MAVRLQPGGEPGLRAAPVRFASHRALQASTEFLKKNGAISSAAVDMDRYPLVGREDQDSNRRANGQRREASPARQPRPHSPVLRETPVAISAAPTGAMRSGVTPVVRGGATACST